MASVEIALKVQFYDLDPMQIVWHGNYPRYFEQARVELMESIGYSFREMEASGYFWPIVDMRIKYVRPLRFGQPIAVSAAIVDYENRLRIDYRIRDRDSGEVLTKATTIQVAVLAATGELCLESPPALTERLRGRS
ncbi:MAG TPA: acyl-CoA thioesterase [Hypericibacter adhaerens]|jgi:acyl-CoA thioester hydrolase|uniref:4-hydroxybenzoyl-CoA thioesterase n=1 Tax=Hypericibacter adhaerens TaxID=2602016 RepID=A0A5J6N7F2_9PROT|nr:acyl-CoA thioesterase [Hypericibacter adhaerens]QEX22996.1 4-hydroxybenzoyl-CoA thioesterase [Hypericibacter adhaerens]HWA44272.1 acyl-CoA thioesterase [Hypericibacter adhaerens]